MHAHDLDRIRVGLLALPLAGLVLAATVLTRGTVPHPRHDPLAFAEGVTAPGFTPAALGLITGLVLLLLALPALHGYLASRRSGPLAVLGLGLSLAGAALLLPLAGALAFALPAAGEQFLAGRAGALDVAFGLFEGPARGMTVAAALLLSLGQLLLGVEMWRAALPRLAALPVAASGVLLTLPFWPPAELAGAAALLVGGVAVAHHAWRTPAPAPAAGPTRAPAAITP